eukprot:jgi/Chlat1/3362/Chrsp23S03717
MVWAAAALSLSGLEEVSWRRWNASTSSTAVVDAHLALLAEGRLTALTAGELWVFTGGAAETLPLSPPGIGTAMPATATTTLLVEIDCGTARPALAPPPVWLALAHALQVRVGRALCEREWSSFGGLYVCTRALSPSSSSPLPSCQLSFVAHASGTITAHVRFSSRNVRFPNAIDVVTNNKNKHKHNNKARTRVITSPYGTPATLVSRASTPVIAELKRRNNAVDGKSNDSHYEVRWATDGPTQPPLLFPAHALLLPRVDTLPPFTMLRRHAHDANVMCWLGDSGACEWVEDSILSYVKDAPTSLRGDDNESATSSSGGAGPDEADEGDSSGDSSGDSEDDGASDSSSDADSDDAAKKASQTVIAQGGKAGSLSAPESQKRATGKRTRSGLATDTATRTKDNTAQQHFASKAEQHHTTTSTSVPNATTYTSPWGDSSLDAAKSSSAGGADNVFDDYDIDKIELADLGDFGNIDDIAFNDVFDDGGAEKSGHTTTTTLYASSTPGTDSNVNVSMMAASPATTLYARTLSHPEGVSALSMLMAPTPPDDRPSTTPHAGVGTPSSFVGTPGNPYTPAPAFTPAHCVATPAVPEPTEDEVVTVPSWIVDMPSVVTSSHWHASLGSTRRERGSDEDYEQSKLEDARGYCPEEYVCKVSVRRTSRGQEYAYDPGAYVKAFCAQNIPKRGLTYAGHFTSDGSAVTDVSRKRVKAEAMLRNKPASHACTSSSAVTVELSATSQLAVTATRTPDPAPSVLVAVLATEAELLRRHQLSLATDNTGSSSNQQASASIHIADEGSPAQLAGLSHTDIAAAACLLAQQTVATFDLALEGANMDGPLAFLASRTRTRSHQLSIADLVTEPNAMDPPDPLFAELSPTLASNLLRADVVPAFVASLGGGCAYAHATLADCADSVTPLRTPLLLAGFHEDWLQVSPDTMQLWDKAPLEPYASPKPVAYQVLCPSIGTLTNAAAEFFHELTAVYEVCNLGSHSANASVNGANAHGLISIDVRDVDSSNPVRLSLTQVEAYRASLHKACARIAQATNTSKLMDPEHDTARVLYIILPLTDAKSTLDIIADACHHLAPPSSAVARGLAGMTLTVHFLSPEQVMRVGSTVHASPASLKNIAFSVYAKIRRMPRHVHANHISGLEITATHDAGGNASDDAFASIVPSPLPFPIPSTANAATDSSAPGLLYEPFAILADANAAPGNAADAEPPAFHCSYSVTQSGRWVVSVWTDARGELLDSFVSYAGPGTAHGEAAPLTPQDEFATRWSPGVVVSDAHADSAARLTHNLRAILRQGFELLRSADTSMPRRIVITALGALTAADREAWQAALSCSANLQTEGVSSVCVCAIPATQSNIQLLPAIEANPPTSPVSGSPSHPLTARFPFIVTHAGHSPAPPLHTDLMQARKTRIPAPVLASAHIVAPPAAALPDHAIRHVSDWPSVLGLELIVCHNAAEATAVDEHAAKVMVKTVAAELYALAWLRTSFLPPPRSRSLLPMHATVTARLQRLVQYYDEEYRPLS